MSAEKRDTYDLSEAEANLPEEDDELPGRSDTPSPEPSKDNPPTLHSQLDLGTDLEAQAANVPDSFIRKIRPSKYTPEERGNVIGYTLNLAEIQRHRLGVLKRKVVKVVMKIEMKSHSEELDKEFHQELQAYSQCFPLTQYLTSAKHGK
jgi:hypothetical protein